MPGTSSGVVTENTPFSESVGRSSRGSGTASRPFRPVAHQVLCGTSKARPHHRAESVRSARPENRRCARACPEEGSQVKLALASLLARALQKRDKLTAYQNPNLSAKNQEFLEKARNIIHALEDKKFCFSQIRKNHRGYLSVGHEYQ